MPSDIKLKYRSDIGAYDIDFKDGDFELTDSLETAILMSVLCEKRATASQVSEPIKRRGHFTNLFNRITDYQTGCFLWLHTEQARNTEENASFIDDTIAAGANWLIEDGFATDVEMSHSRSATGLDITAYIINSINQLSSSYNIYVNTLN